MKFYWVVLPSLLSPLTATSVLGTVPLSSVKRVSNLPTVPNKFIVEVDNLANIPNKRSLVSREPHKLLYASLNERGVGFQVNREFDSAGLFVGAALTLANTQDVAALQNITGVIAIRPVTKISLPQPVNLQVVQSPNDAAVPPDSESTHILTGVNKLHAQGITGRGVKIGIIDTGIDYTHPTLGGGFGPGHKVIGGFDLVGDAYDGTNTPVPGPDPLDQCNGHGTHVGGIIGADPVNPFNISGVAFDASLSAYRVFGCTGFTTDDVIVEALLLGVEDGQDILTLSLGGADGWTESSSSVVASRIAATGKVVTIAAGNDGASGSWYTSSPGNGINVISVASLDNTVIPVQEALVSGIVHNPIVYFDALPLSVTGQLPIFATSNDTTIANDACNPLPSSTPDLSSFLVIVRRGTCTFVQKLTNIAAKGGKVALIYNNANGFAAINVGSFQAALIQAADGEFLVSQFAAGIPITVSFPQTGGSVNFPNPSGGLISTFTSYGPTNDFFFKPAVAAPGGNILSTLPRNTFGVESGTSMATPFVAGSAALLFSVKGNSAAVGTSARTLFETTAQAVASSHTDGDPLQTLTQQGAGLINVFNAIHATTIISPGELILNDSAQFNAGQKFTILNAGTAVQTYNLSHVPAGTALTVRPGTIFPSTGPVPLSTAVLSVKLSIDTLTLRPGESRTITTQFTLPVGIDASTFPVFSGFIEITSGSQSSHVSYLALGASLRDKQVVDNTNLFFGFPLPVVLDSAGAVQAAPTNYTFVNGDFPSLLFRLTFGTPIVRVDLVDANLALNGTLNTRAESIPGFTFPQVHKTGSFAKIPIVGPLAEFDFITRNNEANDNGFDLLSFQQAVFANGTQIPNGSYRFLLRALRVTGNPENEADYESFLSPIVGVTV